MELEDIKIVEIRPFFDLLTVESEYFKFSVDRILNTAAFVKGVRRDGQLAGVGGLIKSFGLVLLSFHMVKSDFQRRGIGNEITKVIIAFAKRKGRSLFLGTVKKGNTSSIIMTKKQGYIIFYEDSDKYWMLFPLNKKGKIIGRFLPLVVRLYLSPIGNVPRFIRRLFTPNKRHSR